MAERRLELPDVTARDAAISARDRVRHIAVSAAMILGAILTGVLPALWISHHRREAAQMAEGSATPPPPVTVEPIEPPPQPTIPAVPATPPQPAVAVPEPTATKAVDKPKRARPRKQAPPCDVYLHPHGCPH